MERGFAYCSRRNPFIFQWLFFTELHYIIFSKLNTSRPVAIHEAVNPKKICCFFCAHFWQISKSSVLDSEAKKGCHFFQTAGKTQLPKRLIVGKDRAAGKVLAGKSVHSALLWFVGSKGKTPARSLL